MKESLNKGWNKRENSLGLKFLSRERIGRYLESKVEYLESRKLSHSK